MYKRILWLVNGTLPPPWAQQKVASLLAAGGEGRARIALFGLSHRLLHPFYNEATDHSLQQALTLAVEAQAQEVFSTCLNDEFDLQIVGQPFSPESIENVVAEYVPDLVIKVCRRHHRLDEYVLGHNDWSLMSVSKQPVLFLRPQSWPRADALRLAVMIDPLHARGQPAELDNRVVSAANELIDGSQGSMTLLHAYQAMPLKAVLDDSLMIDYARLQQRLEKKHLAAMQRFNDQLPPVIKDHLPPGVVLTGEPTHELASYCNQQQIDVSCIGYLRRGGWESLMLGSTAEQIMESLDGDLLVVPYVN